MHWGKAGEIPCTGCQAVIAGLADTQTESETFTTRGNLQFPVHLSLMSVYCEREPELLEETHRNLNAPIHALHFHQWPEMHIFKCEHVPIHKQTVFYLHFRKLSLIT